MFQQDVAVDFDTTIFRAALYGESNGLLFDDDDTDFVGFEHALGYCENVLEELKKDLGSNRMILCLSGSGNFRKDLFPSYKENRKTMKKPRLIKQLRYYFTEVYEGHPVSVVDGVEADDLVGVLGYWEDYLMVSEDKDFDTVPGYHYNPRKKEYRTISHTEAKIAHCIQAMAGDTADNYSGCPSVGVKKATKFILNCIKDYQCPVENYCIPMFEKHGMKKKDFYDSLLISHILKTPEELDWVIREGIKKLPEHYWLPTFDNYDYAVIEENGYRQHQ